MKPNKYYGAAITAFTIWGFFPLALKALTHYPSEQILYFRILFSVALLFIISFVLRRHSLRETYTQYKSGSAREKQKFISLNILGGLCQTVNWFVFIYAINHINIQTGSFSYLLCPILTALLGYVILKEELKPNQWLAIAMSLTSCFLLGTGSLRNLLFSLVIAFSYAFYLIIQRVLKQYDKLVLLTLQLLVTFVLLGPFYRYFNAGHTLGIDLYFFGFILLIALLFTIIPLFLNLFALKELKSGTIGILMYINPIINFIIAFLYFGERANAQQAAAYALIFLSVIIYNLNFKKKPLLVTG